MKKIISILLLYSVFSVGQTMPHWNTQGNTVVNEQYFGSKNAKDVIFKANNTNLFVLKSNGKINLPSLSNTTGQFLTTNDIGDVILKDIATSFNDILTFPTLQDFPAIGEANILYIASTSNYTYYWNGTAYITTTIPAATAWNLTNSSTDAGNNKVQNIYRNGNIGIKQVIPIHEVDAVGIIRALNSNTTNQFRIDPMDVVGPKLKLGTSSNPSAFFEIGAYNSVNNFDSKGRDLKFFSTSKTDLFTLKAASGYVGINTSNPSTFFEINGTKATTQTATTPILRLQRPQDPGVKWESIADFSLGSFSSVINANTRLDLNLSNGLSTATGTVMTWLGSGNVGINITNPARTLDVNGLVRIGNTGFSDIYSNVIIGNSGQSAVRTTLSGDGNYQDFQFVKTNAPINTINNWGFGQRFDTFFGNQSGSFQFIGSYINNSGVGSAVGGGYRVPIICNPDGSIIIAGASANAINGNVGVGTATPTQKLDVTGTVQATQFKLSALNTAPTSSTSTGSVGEIRITNGYIYVCIAVNTWQRATLNTF